MDRMGTLKRLANMAISHDEAASPEVQALVKLAWITLPAMPGTSLRIVRPTKIGYTALAFTAISAAVDEATMAHADMDLLWRIVGERADTERAAIAERRRAQYARDEPMDLDR